MAELLQREFSLPVLKVRLTTEDRQPSIRCQLVVNADGQQQVHGEQTWPMEALGFATDRSTNYKFHLAAPGDLVDWVAGWTHATLDPGSVLWLHLVKPYGQLGAVPWERDLQPACGLPIVRLPDVLPEAERSSSAFAVALCATAPAPEGPSTASTMAPEIARQLALGVGDGLRLEVFSDLEAIDDLERELAALPGKVRIHRPSDDFTDRWERGGAGQNQWLWWMRETLGVTSVDAVHFVVHGVALKDEGAVLTPWSPTDPYRDAPQYVTSADLRRFTTSVGALTLGFSAPYDNYSDYGLRHLADALGARRAGPVVLHDARVDQGDGLTAAYAFLAAQAAPPPPANAGLMMFAQPRQVIADFEAPTAEFKLWGTMQYDTSPAVKAHFEREETPTWLAAAERYLADQEAELERYARSKQSRKAYSASQDSYYAGLEDGLEKIRSVIAQHAEETL